MAEGKSLALPRLLNTHKSFDIWKLRIHAFLCLYKEGDAFFYCTTSFTEVSMLTKEQKSCYFYALLTILLTVDQESLNYVIHPLLQNSMQDNDPYHLWEALKKHFYPWQRNLDTQGRFFSLLCECSP